MATVDELVVKLSADTKQFKSAFVKSEKVVDKSSKGMAKSTEKIGIAISKVQIAATAATAALTLMGRQLLQEADRLQKLSQRLGETTENLSRLKFVAEQNGVSFDTMAMALQRMQRRVAEAAVGTGEAKDALKELGISAQELNQQSLANQFLTVTKAMENLKSTSDRTRLAMKLFDSEGVALTQIMDQGAEAVKRLAKRTPNVITQETANTIAEFNDNMHQLGQIVKSVVLPPLTKVAKVINDLFNPSVKTLKFNIALLEAELEGLQSSGKKWFDWFKDDQIERKSKKLEEYRLKLKQIQETEASGSSTKEENIFDNSKKSIEDVTPAFEKLEKTAGRTATTIQDTMNNSTESWSQNLATSIVGARNGLQSLADFAVSVANQVATALVQQNITDSLVKGAVGAFGGGTGNTPTAPSTPSPAPSITPSARSVSSGQTIVVNQTIQPLTGIDESQVRNIVMQQSPAIAEQAKAGTLQAIRNGGSARQTIRGVR